TTWKRSRNPCRRIWKNCFITAQLAGRASDGRMYFCIRRLCFQLARIAHRVFGLRPSVKAGGVAEKSWTSRGGFWPKELFGGYFGPFFCRFLRTFFAGRDRKRV